MNVKRGVALAACAAMLGAFFMLAVSGEQPTAPEEPASAVPAVTDGMEAVAENDGLRFYADSKTGAVALYNKKTGYTWNSAPDTAGDETLSDGKKRLMESQLEIRYYDEKSMSQERVSQVACVGKGGLSAEKSPDGITFLYAFPAEQITVPLTYKLETDHLTVSIPIDRVKEEGTNRLADISLLPYFGAANPTEEGYFLVPDGSGALIRFNNGKQKNTAYEQKLYGQNNVSAPDKISVDGEQAMLPVLGIHKEGGGLLSVIRSGAEFAKVSAYVAGMKKNYNTAYFSFGYRPYDSILLDSSSARAKEVIVLSDQVAQCGSFTVDFYPMGTKNTYSDMAVKYRSILTASGALSGNAPETLPFYVHSYGAVEKQGSVFWIPAKVMKPLTTYEDAAQMLRALNQSGIGGVVFTYEGWASGGVTGKLPVKGRYESVLGGKTDFEALLRTAEETRTLLLPGIELIHFYSAGNGYSKSGATAKTLNGAPSLQYRYSPFSGMKDTQTNSHYLLAPRLYEDVLNRFQRSYGLDIGGVALRELGNRLYSDNSRGSMDRYQAARTVEKTLEMAGDTWDAVLTSSSNLYAALASDYIADLPATGSGFDIADESVPFYQIVMSGYKSYALPSLNLEGNPRRSFLRAVETGSALCYDFNARNFDETRFTPVEEVFNSNYRDWLDSAAEQYEELAVVYRLTGSHRIVGHEMPATNVTVTIFENGARVIVNYNKTQVTVLGKTIEAEEYVVIL